MAQIDSQRSEFEDPDSSISSFDLPEMQTVESAVESTPLSEDDAFQSSVNDMFESVDAESTEEEVTATEGDEKRLPDSEPKTVDPSDELLIQACSILNEGETEIPTPEESDDYGEEDTEGLMDFPDPQSLLGEQEEKAESQIKGQEESSGSEDVDGMVSMPDLQSLIKEASDETQLEPKDKVPNQETEASPVEIGKSEEEELQTEEAQEQEVANEKMEQPTDEESAPATEFPEIEFKEPEDPDESETVGDSPLTETDAPKSDAATAEQSIEEEHLGSDDDDDLLLDDDAGDDLFLDSDDGFSISDDDDDLVGSASQSTESGTANSRFHSNGLSRIRQYITWPVAAGGPLE
ncbi:MAG TPA: hypothetical protein DIV79_07855 [Opitutae bacterium]|nr:hypothetical protein [Opitutaceae bacterium]HCR29913.1 hypothetical protein [Opitutae bacterium]